MNFLVNDLWQRIVEKEDEVNLLKLSLDNQSIEFGVKYDGMYVGMNDLCECFVSKEEEFFVLQIILQEKNISVENLDVSLSEMNV